MKTFYLVLFLFLLISSKSFNQSLDEALQSLTKDISSEISNSSKIKIAVIEFSDLEGNVNKFGKFLSEELITRLFLTKKFDIIERHLLNKVLDEHKLTSTGLLEPQNAKKLGKILGIDAIVTGTITDLDIKMKINARIISTETGEIYGVASEMINKDASVRKLLGLKNFKSKRSKTHRNKIIHKSDDIFFKEDFSEYKIGDIPFRWGKNIAVLNSKFGGKYIFNQGDKETLGRSIRFPKNFSFSFDFFGNFGAYNSYGQWNDTEKFVLIDSNGDQLVTEIMTKGSAFGYIKLNGIKSKRLDKVISSRKWNSFKIVVKDKIYKVYLNDTFAISGYFRNYIHFKRFTLTANEKRSYRNFIGRKLS